MTLIACVEVRPAPPAPHPLEADQPPAQTIHMDNVEPGTEMPTVAEVVSRETAVQTARRAVPGDLEISNVVFLPRTEFSYMEGTEERRLAVWAISFSPNGSNKAAAIVYVDALDNHVVRLERPG